MVRVIDPYPFWEGSVENGMSPRWDSFAKESFSAEPSAWGGKEIR